MNIPGDNTTGVGLMMNVGGWSALISGAIVYACKARGIPVDPVLATQLATGALTLIQGIIGRITPHTPAAPAVAQ